MRPTTLFICGVLALLTQSAFAQDDPRIMYCGPFNWESNPINGALSRLGLRDDTTNVFQSEEQLLPALRDGPWDLVIIRWFGTFEGPLAGDIIAELAAHVDGGGRLMFSMAKLDEQPEMWPVLGIDGAVDVAEPLQRVQSAYGDTIPSLAHPLFGLGWEVNLDPFLPPTTDHGDVLAPSPGGFAVATYGDDGGPAIVLSRAGRVIVHGPHWDYWDLGSIRVAENQIRWMVRCQADLDGDGELTVFDFLRFQNRFDSGGASGFADFAYDGQLDIFDFLAFFNMFDAGC